MVRLTSWPVDPLKKVFREDSPQEPGTVRIEAARNEFESGQIAVHCDQEKEVFASCGSLQHESSGQRLQCKPRFVGYVHVRENARDTPETEIIHHAPGEFPDYLMDKNPVKVLADQTQPIWLTVFVPSSSSPGSYTGRISIQAGKTEESVDIDLLVHSATLPSEKSLFLTNWVKPANIAKFAKVRPWSEEHWRLLRSHATSMALHRQNVILTPLQLIEIRRESGELSFDFSKFDRWVRLFQDSGVDGLIEGGHLGGRSGKWKSGFNLRSWEVTEEGRKITLPSVTVESEECEEFLSRFLPALQHHLEDQGWVDRYVQHLADEPVDANAESYRCLAHLVRKYAPRLRRIDANMSANLKECLEVWVPVLDQFDQNMGFYRDRIKDGDEVWFYTCLGPRGKYPNRFIDFSLLKVRLLHWMNFKFGLTGYLHWGYNYWTDDPFGDTQPDWSNGAPLPAGDMCIVYPGPNGPIESIRYEAMRDGVEDYELLRLLSGYDPKAASEICDELIRSPTDYERGVDAFRKTREKLLRMIDRIS